ncbi:methyl-accepting chemotaxis protein [Pseudomonas indica]|uniref:Methyl-accepting chemotaxis protein n=1 Tax=Pseudomonas indica TaxID=137658 RepID=A0A1G9HZ47_9PSED|nr:methyl-accepting chemotaxis protein [Pseudomonas indica]PAU64628.1 methyl-accepting chemotaxis protein [Pseudomonas indica]SDL18122.1 methyl-accepting chemotaxis protein [Pseudomonas indica]
MTGVLKPGVRLLERFSFARKFQLVFLLFLLPMGYALWTIVSDHVERLSLMDQERAGMHTVQVLSDVQKALLEQRTLFARWKGTEKQAEALLTQRAGALDEALAQVQATLQREPLGDAATRQLEALQGMRGELAVEAVGRMALPDALERYQKVLLQLTALREQVATDSGLILDPKLDTYLMMEQLTASLPRLLENLGSFASQGHGAVVSQHFTLQSRVVIRDLRRALEESRAQLHKVRTTLEREAPAVAASLREPGDRAQGGLDRFLERIDREMFDSNPIALTPEAFIQAVEQLEGDLRGFEQALFGEFDQRVAGYRDEDRAVLVEVVAAFTVLTLLALYVLFCLNASIQRSTASITAAAEGLRAGDLSVRVAVQGQDELAGIAASLNTAVAQLRESLEGVNTESRQLGGTVQLLNAQAQDSLGAVEQQQGQVSQIATAATQLAATAQSVAESCEQAAADAGQTREIAVQSNQRSARTSASMRQLSARLGDTTATLQKLREQTQQINRIVDVIKGIAEQTNLLALNAAIEAARAGEQGRGFAVVADEVRSLSQRTQDSTQEIGKTVEDLQKVVGEAVGLMEDAFRQAETDVGSVLAMGEDLDSIAEAVQRVSDRLAQIATAAEQQAATADEVSGNIQQVDQAASHLLAGAQAVSEAAEQLRRGSEVLERNTGRFRLG